MVALLLCGAAVGAAAAGFIFRRLWLLPLRELELGVRRWSEGNLAAELDRGRLGARGGLAELFEQARDQVFKLIGERKREAIKDRIRVDTLIQYIPDGLVVTNLRGDVLYINPPAVEVLGLKPEDLPGRRLMDIVSSTEVRMKIQEILKNHTHSNVLELANPRGGGVSTFKTQVALFSSPGGEDLGVLLVLRDVTAERKLDALKEEFFQAVAHDLRAPLFAMQGYLRLLEKSLHPDKHQKGYLDAIGQSCEKLTLFIQDTLDSARIESGQMKLTVTPIDPRVLLQRALDLFRPLADERGVRLSLEAPMDAPAAVDVDERLMERVFYNLISNALKFTPRGGSITVELAQAGPNQAEFSVIDTGPGIPAEERGRIFEKFSQAESGGAPLSGYGLGLAISRKIVKLHNGIIWVDSEPGAGSQFTVRIPIRQEVPQNVPAKDG